MFAPPAEVLPQSVLAEAGYPSVRVDEEETRSREVGVRVCRRRLVGPRERDRRAGLLNRSGRRLGLCGSAVFSRWLSVSVRLVCASCRRCDVVLAACVFACCVCVVVSAS